MHTIDVGTLADWLEAKFREWRAVQTSKRAGVTQFAAYLDTSRNTLNNWMLKGQTPDTDSIDKISSKLGPGIYDVLGLPRPDPDLQEFIHTWGEFTDDERSDIRAVVEAAKARRRGEAPRPRAGKTRPKRA